MQSNVNIDLSDLAVNSACTDNGHDFLLKMEGGENWVVDGNNELNAKLVQWAKTLVSDSDIDSIRECSLSLFKIVSFVRIRKAMHLLGKLDERMPGLPYELLYAAKEEIDSGNADDVTKRSYQIHAERLVVLYRSDYLRKIFSPKRSAQIAEVLEELDI